MNTRWNPRRTALSALFLGVVSIVPSRARADNPIVQTSYTADPAPVVYGDRLYLYTSHDEDVTVDNFYTMINWRLYSTEDMVNWTDHGSPAGLDTFSWSTDSAWAPQAISRNGKYYLYVPINNNTGAKIGVAVSDTIVGQYTDPLGRELAASGSGNIDPTVFIDDDGQAYMYWGNGTLRYVRLNEDMISTAGSITNVDMPGFTEGPWFYKRESLYYLVYAATSGTEKISYATSDSPTGPWTSRGDIMGPGSTFTNHAGIVDYKGHSYFFYHNSALPGGGDFKRSVCVEEFTYGADGSIPQLTMSTEGPDAVDTLNPFEQVEAETIAFSSGLKTEVCTDTGAGMNVTSISDGDYIKVKDVEFLDGVTSFDARVSSSGDSAAIELHLDSQDGTLLGTCDVSGASSWTTKTCTVSGGSGKHDLFLKFTGSGGGDLFKFNWWKFSGPTVPTDDGGVGGSTSTGSDAGGAGSSSTTGAGGVGGSAATTSGGGAATVGSTASTTGGANVSTTGDATTTVGTNTSADGASSVGSGTTSPASMDASAVSSNTSGAPTGAPGDADEGGCSCRTARSTGPTGLAWLAFAVAGVAVGRRRRARR